MDQKSLVEFMKEKGFRTRTEINEHFKDAQDEVLETYLMALVAKNVIRRMDYQDGNKRGELYALPYE